MQDEQRNLFMSSRDRHPPNEAAVFIENHVALSGQQRPVFSERGGGFVSLNEANKQQQERYLTPGDMAPVLIPAYKSFCSTALWKEVDEEKERLFELMQQVQKKLSKEQSSDDMIDLRKCSWREVMGQVQKTAQRWKLRPNKQGRTMVFIDKLGRHSSALESWLGLLPSGDYGSSICGVFKLAIGAAGQYGKVEETIFEALSEIPIIMESAGRYVDMYWKMRDQYLEQRTFELFRAILQMLRYVMQFFAEGKTRKVFEGMMKQEGYKAEINESLEEIRKRAQAVNNEAQQCQARMVFKISDKLDENKEQAHVIFQMLNELLLTHPRLRSDPQEDRIHGSESYLQVTGYDWVNADHLAPSDLGDSPEEHSPLRGTSSPFIQHNSNMNNTTDAKNRRKQLLKCLRYDPEASLQDMSSFIRLGYHLSNREKSRAAVMITSDQFISFMQETRLSTCLLVNGRQDLATSNSQSPLSLAVAELVNKSQEKGSDLGPVFVISYFCAARQPWSSTNASASQNSAAGMIASLIGQLIEQLGDRDIIVDLSFMSSKTWRRVEELEPKTLCRIFRKLIGQIPPGSAILCMIDEVSLYETQMLEHQTSYVMEKLVQLVRQEQDDAQQVFKLLVTCQDRALGISRLFSGCTLELPEEIEMDDTADWAISAM